MKHWFNQFVVLTLISDLFEVFSSYPLYLLDFITESLTELSDYPSHDLSILCSHLDIGYILILHVPLYVHVRIQPFGSYLALCVLECLVNCLNQGCPRSQHIRSCLFWIGGHNQVRGHWWLGLKFQSRGRGTHWRQILMQGLVVRRDWMGAWVPWDVWGRPLRGHIVIIDMHYVTFII